MAAVIKRVWRRSGPRSVSALAVLGMVTASPCTEAAEGWYLTHIMLVTRWELLDSRRLDAALKSRPTQPFPSDKACEAERERRLASLKKSQAVKPLNDSDAGLSLALRAATCTRASDVSSTPGRACCDGKGGMPR